ncbi:hypothetical protein VPH35_029157 [Triticum aestivum]
MTLILRRLAQIEQKNSTNGDGAIWRKFMEPDFTHRPIVCRFSPNRTLNGETHRPMLNDILKKRIVVLDPQAGPFGFMTDRVKFHEQVNHAIYWMEKRVPYIDD